MSALLRRESRAASFMAMFFARTIAISLLLLAGCDGADSSEARNVILITLDTTRPDALACYGGYERATPNLARLAQESLVFDEARTIAPLTLPAHASMLTGLVPPRHGVRDNGIARLPAAAETLAERARSAGVDTAAFVSALVLDRGFGLDQGFETYDQPVRPTAQTSSHYVERHARETLSAATHWLDAHGSERRFFMWVHLFDAHVPYQPPPEFLALAGGDAYRGEVAWVDHELGGFLDHLRERGVLDESLLIVVADHGESLGEHGEATHSAFCYDATLRVPLLVRRPRARRGGERSNAPVSVVDVEPTVARALGLTADATLDGLDLLGDVPADRRVYCESYGGFLNYGWSPLAGVVGKRTKYLASSAEEFYDLAHDPHERTNRAAERRDDVAAARRALEAFLAKPALAPEPIDASAESVEWLRGLGYAASGDAARALPSPLAPSDRPSPASRASELEPLLLANAALDAGRWEEADRLLAPILASNPRNALAHDLAALAALQLGHFERARELCLARLELGPERADTRINLAVACERLGDVERAEREWRRALVLDPGNPQAVEGLAARCEARGAVDEARELRATLHSVSPPSSKSPRTP